MMFYIGIYGSRGVACRVTLCDLSFAHKNIYFLERETPSEVSGIGEMCALSLSSVSVHPNGKREVDFYRRSRIMPDEADFKYPRRTIRITNIYVQQRYRINSSQVVHEIHNRSW